MINQWNYTVRKIKNKLYLKSKIDATPKPTRIRHRTRLTTVIKKANLNNIESHSSKLWLYYQLLERAASV